jgi:predicted phosphodiesterase
MDYPSGVLNRSHFTRPFCIQLLTEFHTKRDAAKALHGRVFGHLGDLISTTTIERYILQGLTPVAGREDEDRSARLEKLLEKANLPLQEVGSVSKIKFSQWGYHQKDADGNPVEGVLDSTEVHITPAAPAFPLAQPANPNIIQFTEPPRILKATKSVVVVSDTQIGFLQDPETKSIEAIHDPLAMRVAELITRSVDPNEVVYIGDWMDWPFLSRWQQHDEFDAVNESIQEAYNWLCRFKAACREGTKFTMIGGNHDIRPEKMLLEHNRKAMRIRRAADTSGWPVFSQPYLLRYEELGIQYPGHYPGGEYFLLPDLVLTHAPPKAKEFQASVIHGHTHHIGRQTSVQHANMGRKTYHTYDIGCLCQVGSTENRQRLMVTRVPSDRARTDWAQGIAVVNIVDGGRFSVDQIEIHHNWALYGGQLFDANA